MKCAKTDCEGHWVTHRLARYLNLTDREIAALPSINVEAPNGILWTAVQVTHEQYKEEHP